MSAIFISHSSRDAAAAAEVRERLQAEGHRSIFLDFDPADGIPAGRSWERELYARLRACQAIVVLASEASMASDWVFAEITHAKSLGKQIFPLKIEPCEIRSLLSEFQVLDLTADREDAYARLARGLVVAGLDPKNMFDWDGSRPPYPGLLAFQAEDAAIFFGRDAEIREGLAQLRRLERFGGARFTLVLGASGSGKSSLVRAGLLPRLARDRDAWLTTRPFRPLEQPFDRLARVLAEAFERHGAPRERPEILRALYPPTGIADGEALVEMADELRAAAGRPAAAVLLAIDQVEELLGAGTGDPAARFLAFLRSATERRGSPVRVLGTLRSDFLGAFQAHPALRELAFESLAVGPMSADGFARVIEGPAELAGIELGPGLVQAMVADTETDDALPLLAFTLRELWEGYGEDARLGVEEYRDRLGGLSGAVARAAEAVLSAGSAAPGAAGRPVSGDELAELRDAFLAMVRINAEGRYARRPASWADLPAGVHGLLERFVEARLLVAQGNAREGRLEVAHEALLRSWDRLVAWLDEGRAFLVWRKRLEAARREWQRTERDAGALLRGAALAEARGWSAKRRDLLSREQMDFIAASVGAERRRRRRRVAAVALAVALLAVFAGWSHMQRLMTEKVMLMADDTRVLGHSRGVRRADPLRSSQALLELHNPEVFLKSLDLEELHLSGGVLGKSRDMMLIAVATERGIEVKLGFDGRWSVPLPHAAPVYAVAIEGTEGLGPAGDLGWPSSGAARGRRVLTAAEDLVVRLWELPEIETILSRLLDGKLPRRPGGSGEAVQGRLLAAFDGHEARVSVMSVSPDGFYAATACGDQVALWRTDEGTEPILLGGQAGAVTAAGFDRASRWLLTTSDDGNARTWSLGDVFAAPRVIAGHRVGLVSGAFSPDGASVLTLSRDGEVRRWLTATGEGSKVATADCEGVAIGFAGGVDAAILACADGTARIFDPAGGEMKVLR